MGTFDHPIGDPARQATSPMRAYDYQVWRTIHGWLELGDNEQLLIEGVEDFDIIAGKSAILNQIKNKKASGNLTLNSTDVREAINNYWRAKSENPRFRIQLYFVTTADVTVERGEPFGAGVAGVDLWRRCQAERDAKIALGIADQLRTYLRDSERVAPCLRGWLSTAEPQEVREHLILPVSWLTKQPEIKAVREAVRRKLVLECDRKGVSSAEAPRVADRLHNAAWTVATQARIKDRVLDRALLIEAFDQATHVSVPLARQAEAVLGGGSSGPGLAVWDVLSGVAGVNADHMRLVPSLARWEAPFNEAWLPRTHIIEDLAGRLDRSDVLVIAGSTGTGKSTLAALLSRAQDDGGTRLWLRCGGQPPELVQALLWMAGQEIDRQRGSALVVVDDLNLRQDCRSFELALIALAETIRIRGGRMIVTSTSDLTQALKQRLAPSRTDCFYTPLFDQNDVAVLLSGWGCPEDRLDALGRTVWLRTSGHPQLVLVRLHALSQAGFPAPSAQDLLGELLDLREARREARRLLAASCDAHAKELLYRLSLTTGFFPRRIVFEVAKAEPPVEFPGDNLDALVGPWIDEDGSHGLRVSPLLATSGREAHGPAWSTRMHSVLARAWLNHRSLDQGDASAILFHGSMARDAVPLVTISGALLGRGRADREDWGLLANYLAWFASMPVSEKTLPRSQPFERFMINLLRYRIAAESAPAQLEGVVSDIEFSLQDMKADRLGHDMSVFMWSFVLIITFKAKHRINVILDAVLNVVRLNEELAGVADLPRRLRSPPAFADEDGKTDVTALFPVALFGRLTTPGDLDELRSWLDRLEPGLRGRLLRRLEGTELGATAILDSVWLKEHEKGEAAVWEPVARAARELARRASTWGAPRVGAAAVQVAARTLDENLQRPEEALALLTSAIKVQPGSNILRNALAQLHYNAKEYEEALDVWSGLLPAWELLFSAGETDLVFAYQRAAECAAHLGDWCQAATLFHRGCYWASRLKGDRLPLALLADAGYAEYRDGQHREFVDHFAEVLERLLDTVHRESTASWQHKLFRLVGQVLTWINAKMSKEQLPETLSWEPLPGMCATYSASGMFQGVETLETVAPEVLWGYLAEIEWRLCGSWVILDRKGEALAASPHPAARMTACRLRTYRSYERLDVREYGEATVGLIKASLALRDLQRDGDSVMGRRLDSDLPADDSMVPGFWRIATLSLTVRLAAQPGGRLAELRELVDIARVRGVPDEVGEMMRGMVKMVGLPGWRLTALVQGREVPIHETVTASVILLASHDSDARDVFTALVRVSEHFLTRERPLVPGPPEDLAHIAASACSRLASRPFALRAPRIAVPALEKAANSSKVGWGKIFEITAALNVVAGTTINPAFLARLREQSEGAWFSA